MTVRELLDVLNALPEDCRELPVLLEMGDALANAKMVDIFPPKNVRREPPCVIIAEVVFVSNGRELPARYCERDH